MLPTTPIRETVEKLCPRCGDKFEDQTSNAKTCYACWLAGLIKKPRSYMHREKYDTLPLTASHPKSKATVLPRTGIAFLDRRIFVAESESRNRREIIEMRKQEKQVGMEQSEYWHPKVYS